MRTGSPGTPGPRRARLDTLAERIKAEHLACDSAISDALEHALAAGDLLIEAKTLVGWGVWEEWVVANCRVSVRRAQEYMQLARGRDKLGKVKARGPALLSIEEALKTLRRAHYSGGWQQQRSLAPAVPGTTPLTPEQERAQRAREREQQRLQQRAEYAIRTGNTDPPSGTPLAKWQHVIYEVGQRREQNIPNVLDALGHNLHILLRHARPEEEGRRLAEPTNDHDEAEYRVGLIEELREGVAWLTKVIEEAEAARRRED